MKAQRAQLKLYAAAGTLGDPERVVPVFHAWIREKVLPELLVDVARYGHLHRGPAVALIGAETDYVIDLAEDRPGLAVIRKRDGAKQPGDRLDDVFRRALHAASVLEKTPELAGLAFDEDELLLVVPDRLNAPNDEQTFAALAPEIREVASRFLGSVSLEREGSPREPFSVRIRRSGA